MEEAVVKYAVDAGLTAKDQSERKNCVIQSR